MNKIQKQNKGKNGLFNTFFVTILLLLQISVFAQVPPPPPTGGGGNTNTVTSPVDVVPPVTYPTNATLKWNFRLAASDVDFTFAAPMANPDGSVSLLGAGGTLNFGGGTSGGNLITLVNSNMVWAGVFNSPLVRRQIAYGGETNLYILALDTNTQTRLMSINPRTGQTNGNYFLGGALANWDYYGPQAIGPDGTVYTCWYSMVVAITNGATKWQYSEDSTTQTWIDIFNGREMSIGLDNTVYISSKSLYSGYTGYHPPHLYAITNGAVKWSVIGNFSMPVLYKDTIYSVTTNRLYAISSNGVVKWISAPLYTQSPEIGPGGTIYIEGFNGLSAITPAGAVKWTFPTTTSHCAIACDGQIFVASTNTLYSLNQSGQTNWSYPLPTCQVGIPQLGYDGTLYLTAEKWEPMDPYTYDPPHRGDYYLYVFAAPNAACGGWPQFMANSRHTSAQETATAYNGGYTTNGYQLKLTGPTNLFVCPCASRNFIDWTNLGVVKLVGGSTNYVDTNAVNYPKRFYYANPQ